MPALGGLQGGQRSRTATRAVRQQHSVAARARPLAWRPDRGALLVQNIAKAAPSAVTKDATAELLERVFNFALSSRLKQHSGIDVDVRCTGWGLMEGKFGGMTVDGKRWRTPLELTAERILVDVGELQIDYGKLMFQQSVALRNVPQGSCSITLTPRDLANFVVHPIMRSAAAKAVKGRAFDFDRSCITMSVDPVSGRGTAGFEGVWLGDGQRYSVVMVTPPPLSRAGAPGQGSAPLQSSNMDQLQVTATRLAPKLPVPPTGSLSSGDELPAVQRRPFNAAGFASTSSAPAATLPRGAQLPDNTLVVAEGMRLFFSQLLINLQGIELCRPRLVIYPAPGAAAGRAVPGPAGGAPPPPPGSPLLQITMQLAIKELPPLNMKF